MVPSEPASANASELFERERELRQMPVRRAFTRPKELEPALAEIEREVAAGRLNASAKTGFGPIEIPLGRTVSQKDPLLCSDLAFNIAALYLDVLGG